MQRRQAAVLLAMLALMMVMSGCGRGKAPADSAAGNPAAPAAETPAVGAPAGAAAVAGGQRYVIDGGRSSASYSVQEKFVNRELPNLAVGTTSAVSGELVLTEGGPGPSVVTVDISTLRSDSGRRDNQLRGRYLESNKYPMAEFRITGTEGTAPEFAEGQEAHFKLTGTLLLHGTEKSVTWEARGTRTGDTMVWNAMSEFKLTDFHMEVPDIAGMLKVDDWARVEVTVTATLAAS